MALEHFETKMGAIKRICRALQIKVTTLEVISADELMDKQFEDRGMLIEKLIGRGVYLIAGSPKIGKSWLMLWLAHCVSTGANVWEFRTQQCEVLYISLEDPDQRLQKVRQIRPDQYSYAGDYEVISQMKSIAARFDITILLVHHTRKSGASDPFALISGTTGLSGGVDGSLVMVKDDRQDTLATL